MAYAKQRGNGRNGELTGGDSVVAPDGLRGEVAYFSGGSHGWVTIRSESGYSYTYNTHEVRKDRRR